MAKQISLTYFFGEYEDEAFEYFPDNWEFNVASLMADEINKSRKEQADKMHTEFKEITATDVFDTIDKVYGFDDLDISDYIEDLTDMYYSEAYGEWKENWGY